MPTIYDVAKKAGVSKSSVSRVINKRFEYMRDDTKKKILDAIEELNYTPNSLAQSLKTNRTKVIGIVLSDIANPLWAELLNGVQEECMRSGYGLMVSSSNEKPELERENIAILRNKKADGLIINNTGQNQDIYQDLVKEKYPFVFLDRTYQDVQADSVLVNNILGAKKVMKHLINQGHRRIAIVLYPTENKSPRIERLEGYKQALAENQLPFSQELVKICAPIRGSGIQAAQELLSLPEPPTAIFSTHAFLNLELLAAAKKSGWHIPKDVSIIGYDDFPWVPFLAPPLSTVSQPAHKMGVQAAALIINKIKRKREVKSKTILLEPTLIVRESCSPPQ
ncbi:MAG: LacI family DNA-binding transcriptional regulator [Bacillota bacterium]|nr:LacI family DNA-binding transcriptional regulator [Bacillota bacterium]